MERTYFLVVIILIAVGCLYIQKNVIIPPAANEELAKKYYSMSAKAESGDMESNKEQLVATLNALGHIHHARAEMDGIYRSSLGHLLKFIFVVLGIQLIFMVLPYVRSNNA